MGRSLSVWTTSVSLCLAGCATDVGVHREAVIHGRPASAAELYGTVAIPFGGLDGGPDGTSMCTGTLIRPNVVLSAAHCFFAHDENDEPTGTLAPLDELEVVAGARSVFEATAEQRYRVIDVRVAPGYDHVGFWNAAGDLGPVWSDLALAITDRPVTQVAVIPLLAADELQRFTAGSRVTVSGYGATRFVDDEALGLGALMLAELSVEGFSTTELSASAPSGADTCSGDSGGPAYFFVDDAPRVAAVTSRGSPEGGLLCGDGGFYTLPHAFEAWILDEVGPPSAQGGGCSVRPTRQAGLTLPAMLALAALALRARWRR